MKYSDLTIDEFLDKLSSTSPMPGGGSVTALTGALASSLLEKIVHLMLNNKKYADRKDKLAKTAETLKSNRERFLTLMDEDAKNYLPLGKAFKLPNNTAEERKLREKEIEKKSVTACSVPVKMIAMIKSTLIVIEGLIDICPQILISDLNIGVFLCYQTLMSNYQTLMINLSNINDEAILEEFKTVKTEHNQLLLQLQEMIEKTNK